MKQSLKLIRVTFTTKLFRRSKTESVFINNREQIYGTNWLQDDSGDFFLVPVINFKKVNDLRARYSLGPVMKPTVLSFGEDKYPLGHSKAQASNQKDLTDKEYLDYIDYLEEF